MKNLLITIFFLASLTSFAQVQCVNYELEYNNETSQYDVSLVIINGSASSPFDRSQYNSQVTVIAPFGQQLNIVERYMPIQGNHNQTGITPGGWTVLNQLNFPETSPTKSFYSISPILSPSSFYNDLEFEEVIKLFSFIVGESGEFDSEVRLFNNETDPTSLDPNMFGSNFSNTFRLGNSDNIYRNNSESCITNTNEKFTLENNIYPNPFQDQIILELSENVKMVQVLGLSGKVYYTLFDISKEALTINTTLFPSGIYFVIIETNSGFQLNTRIVKI